MYETWYDFIYRFKDLKFSNNMNIKKMCMIVILRIYKFMLYLFIILDDVLTVTSIFF